MWRVAAICSLFLKEDKERSLHPSRVTGGALRKYFPIDKVIKYYHSLGILGITEHVDSEKFLLID